MSSILNNCSDRDRCYFYKRTLDTSTRGYMPSLGVSARRSLLGVPQRAV